MEIKTCLRRLAMEIKTCLRRLAMEIKTCLRRLAIKIKTRLKPLVENPLLNLMAGLALLIFSLMEVFPTLLEDIKTFNLGSHHGVSIFGAWHIFKVLPDCLEGIERIFR